MFVARSDLKMEWTNFQMKTTTVIGTRPKMEGGQLRLKMKMKIGLICRKGLLIPQGRKTNGKI